MNTSMFKVPIVAWLCVFMYFIPITTQGVETQLELNVENSFCGTAYGIYSPDFRGLHTGQDYCNVLNTKIESLSFGKVVFRNDMIETPNCAGRRWPNACEGQPDHGMGNVLEIRYLLSNGEEVVGSYNHLNRIDDTANQNNFVAKEQVIGYMGRSGQRSLNYYNDIHLHFEMKVAPRELVNNALEKPWGYSRDKDENDQFVHPDHYGFISPNDYLNTQRVLLPFLSRNSAIPDSTNYHVFGYANKPLYGSLNVSGEFYHAAIVVRNNSSRNEAENHIDFSATPSRLGEVGTWNSNTLINVDGVSGNTTAYQDGDYLFLASLSDADSKRYGYPIVFSILEENALIVDNDQLEEQTGEEREQTEFFTPSVQPEYYSNVVPGYFLSAGLIKGQSDKSAKWSPKRRGTFKIMVHIPDGATAEKVRYKIITKKDNGDNKQVYITDPIDHSNAGWQTLSVTENGNVNKHFFLGKDDFVKLHVNTEYVAEHWNDVGENNTNMGITANQSVAIDAIKFTGGLQEDSLTKIRTGLKITGDAEEATDTARAVYRNYMTEAPNSIETSQADETISVEHDSDNNLSQYTLNDSVITISWTDGAVVEGAANTDDAEPVEPSPSITVNIVDKTNGNIQISGTGLGNAGIITINEQEVQGQWTDEGISLNTGITLENIEQPVQIKVFDDSGNEVVNIYYPFVDVFPYTWYARQVITLWKKGIVNAYGGAWEGYFRPYKKPEASDEFVTDGYLDSEFKLGQYTTRAKMAEAICIAAFGPMECLEMGRTDERPFIFAVTPEIATLNESTVFTVVGQNLTEGIVFELADCPNVNPIAGGTAEERLFQCTPSNTGGVKNGTLQHNLLYVPVNFTINVQEQITPKVTSVSPLTATLNELTTFTVVGSDLPDSLAFWIANCDGVTAISRTSEQQQFQCTPTNGATGSQEGVVKDESGLNKLKVFFVEVAEPVSEPPPVDDPPVDDPPVDDPPVDDPPVDDPPPDTGCTPSVDSVEPLTVTISEPVTFTVYGSCLPETTAFHVGRCADKESLGGSDTERQFRCTPSYSAGIQDDGVVKDKSGGTELYTFSVNVEWGTPKVTSVTPDTANFDEPNTFTVKGTSLLDSTAFWFEDCDGTTQLADGLAEERRFQCTPINSTGIKNGVVKDEPGGKVLYDFTVDVN